MPDLKISQLPVASTPLAGTELVPIVQGGTTDQTTVQAIMTSTVPSGTANGVLYLNGSKVATSGTDLVFNATGLGIGTSSPATKLHVVGTATFGDGTNGQIRLTSSSSLNYFDSLDNAASAWQTLTQRATVFDWFTAASGTPSTGMRLNSSGNLGLGVTPSAWSQGKGFEVLNAGYGLWNGSGSPASIYMTANAYFNGGWKYGGTGQASHYYQYLGQHIWSTAASGTAGNAISFTQAMTLDASGNLGVGSTTPSLTAGYRYISILDGSTGSALSFRKSTNAEYGSLFATASDNSINLYATLVGPLILGTSGVERARITSGGELLVGTQSEAVTVNGLKFFSDGAFYSVQNSGVTSSIYNKSNYTSGTDFFADFRLANTTVGSISANGSTTSYSTSSDRRLKENIAPAADAGEVIDAIEVIQHDWKAGGHTRYGVVAQDLHAVAPEAVTQGDDGDEIVRTWGVDYSKLVPMLIKEIQSLRARVAALEAQP